MVPVREKMQIVMDVDPTVVGLGQNEIQSTRRDVEEIQVQGVLVPVHGLNAETLVVREPLDSDDVLENDPGELVDLSTDPSHSGILDVWRKRLIDKLKDRDDGFSDGKTLNPKREWYGPDVSGT